MLWKLPKKIKGVSQSLCSLTNIGTYLIHSSIRSASHHLAQKSIIIYGSNKVGRNNTSWVQEFVNLTKLWQHHFLVIFFNNCGGKRITNIFFYHFHVLMMRVKHDYHCVWAFKGEYVYANANNVAKTSITQPSCDASYIEISNRNHLKPKVERGLSLCKLLFASWKPR